MSIQFSVIYIGLKKNAFYIYLEFFLSKYISTDAIDMKCHMKWSNPLNDSKKAVYQVLDVSLINTARPDNELII